MAHLIRNGDCRPALSSRRLIFILALFLSLSINSFAQTPPVCTPGFSATTIHAEGWAEPVGPITLTCTGGTAGTTINATLGITLNTNITNRLDDNGNYNNITVTNSFSGSANTAGVARPIGQTQVLLQNVQYIVPSPSATAITLQINGLLAAAAKLTSGTTAANITATVIAVGLQLSSVSPNTAIVGVAAPGLLSSTLVNPVQCGVQPPAIDFPDLVSGGVSFSTVRVTEGFANSFLPKQPSGDTGTRIIVNLSGYGASSVFVPDAIVGTTGAAPTSAGAFASTINAGAYSPGAGQLLLMRVGSTDQTGAGGYLVSPAPTFYSTFSTVTQINLTNGSGYVVYEVVDSNPGVKESAQIPVFAVPASSNCLNLVPTGLSATLAPVSTVAVATSTDPIPRFMAVTPASDCQQIGDCSAPYFPQFSVNTTPVTLSGTALGGYQQAYIQVNNLGGGGFTYMVSVAYSPGSGSGWLTVSPTTGLSNSQVTLTANPANLTQGVYQANVIISAGQLGSATIPVTFTVNAPSVAITSVVNSASFTQNAALVSNEFATAFGMNLSGMSVQVFVNGVNAPVNFFSSTQINFLMPVLGNITSANVVAIVDQKHSNTFPITLTTTSPAVFNPGIVNQDNTINQPNNPEARGNYIQIFLTGLSAPDPTVDTVVIGSVPNQVTLSMPTYAGPVVSIPGLEQVNVQIPLTLPFTGIAPLSICAPVPGAQPACSPPVNVYVK